MIRYKLLSLILAGLSLTACGPGGQASIEQQYLEAVVAGDITTAKDLFCGLSDELRIMELTNAETWEVVDTTDQVFGDVTLVNHEVQVKSAVTGGGTYIISVADASDIEAFIQHNNRVSNTADTYNPDDYKQSGSCIAATQRQR